MGCTTNSYSSINPRSAKAQREGHAAHEQAVAWLLLELLNGFPQVPLYELRVPIDPVQGSRHDVLLCAVDRLGEGDHPISHPVRPCSRRRLPPRCLHHLVGHPAKEKGIGSFQMRGPIAIRLLVRGDRHPVIAAAVEGDVDRVSERSHRLLSLAAVAGTWRTVIRPAPPPFLIGPPVGPAGRARGSRTRSTEGPAPCPASADRGQHTPRHISAAMKERGLRSP
jgi:hypothetical protein